MNENETCIFVWWCVDERSGYRPWILELLIGYGIHLMFWKKTLTIQCMVKYDPLSTYQVFAGIEPISYLCNQYFIAYTGMNNCNMLDALRCVCGTSRKKDEILVWVRTALR